VTVELPSPARYFPLEKGLYEVAPGLHPLGRSFGNGALDSQALQITSAFPRYRANKLAARAERFSKYVTATECDARTASAVNAFLVERLCAEHPELFTREAQGDACILHAHHTGDRIALDPSHALAEGSVGEVPFASAFDALCLQFECDVAVVRAEGERETFRDWLAALHLCAPSHWAAEDKIGLPFTAIHAPIPHIEKVNAAAESLVRAMVHRGPYVRFVWGFATDDRLNHHPEPPLGEDPGTWRGRAFDEAREPSPFLLRVERQVTVGIPEAGAALFGIHVSFIEGAAIRANERERTLFAAALRSLSPASRVYKSIEGSLDRVLAYLEG
jgi:dimethylamine monooxygenase subunit A